MIMSTRPFVAALSAGVLAAGLTAFQADVFAEKVDSARSMALGAGILINM